ncbi:hypothetical protein Tco_1063556 [Tanacetum coccineum]
MKNGRHGHLLDQDGKDGTKYSYGGYKVCDIFQIIRNLLSHGDAHAFHSSLLQRIAKEILISTHQSRFFPPDQKMLCEVASMVVAL